MARGGRRRGSGRKPIPDSLRKLRGNPGKRTLKDNGLILKKPAKVPRAPRHLRDAAKKEWKRIAPKLFDAGLLTELDTVALAAYCEVYASWVDVINQLKSKNLTDQESTIYARIEKKYFNQMEQMAKEFGMTPASRRGLRIAKSSKNSALDDFIDE